MRRAAVLAVVVLAACGLEERDDFLIGRQCDLAADQPCDEGQVCLPHAYTEGRLTEPRCRDRASFEPIAGRPAPLAYCDEAQGYVCPAGLVCNADRIRLDAGYRAKVCKRPRPEDPFAPPLDAGPSW